MLSDVLRSAGRWRVLLVLLPIACAAAAVGLVHKPVTEWTATATVLTAPSATDRTGAQYVNDLQAVLRSDTVTVPVAAQTGASASSLRSSLTSSLLSSGSSLLQVSYTSTNRARAEAVPAAAARVGLQSLVNPTFVAAQSQLTTSENDYQRAVNARDAYTGQIGLALPEQTYQSQLTQISQLRTSAATVRATARDGADAIDAQADALQAQVDALAPKVVTYRGLQADVDRTFTVLSTTRSDVTSLQAQQVALASPKTVTTSPATAQSSDRQALQTAAAAAVVGLVFAFLILVGLGLTRRRQPATGAEPDLQPDVQPDEDQEEGLAQDLLGPPDNRVPHQPLTSAPGDSPAPRALR